MNYEINSNTLAIIPYFNNQSKVIESEGEYIVDGTPYDVMEHSCEYFGSSLEGRLKGSKNILGSIYKAPVMVEEYRGLIFFPIKSITLNDENVWISLKSVIKYEKEDNKTRLFFNNNDSLLLDIPYYSFENQVLRATRLEAVMKNRKIA